MYKLCDKIKNLEPYEPNTGEYRIRLDANESYFLPNNEMKRDIAQIASNIDFNRYPDPKAVKLCAAFADYYGVNSENVVAGNGSDELISIIANSFLMPNETAIVTAPDFSMYSFYFSLAGVNVITAQKNGELNVSVEELIALAKKNNARMIMFSNPCNPTGQIVSRNDVIKLVTSTDALVVLDEAYMDFADESLLSEVCDYDNLLILRTCSKAIGMAALRLGFAVGNTTLVNALKAAKSPYNVNTLSMEIGTYILSKKDYLKACTQEILSLRDSLLSDFKLLSEKFGLKMFNTYTNFILIEDERAGYIFDNLKKKGIIIRKLGDRLLRITVGSMNENIALIGAMNDILSGKAE